MDRKHDNYALNTSTPLFAAGRRYFRGRLSGRALRVVVVLGCIAFWVTILALILS